MTINVSKMDAECPILREFQLHLTQCGSGQTIPHVTTVKITKKKSVVYMGPQDVLLVGSRLLQHSASYAEKLIAETQICSLKTCAK